MFKILSHTADVGIEVSGKSLENLFTEAARAWKHCVIETSPTEPREVREVYLRAANPEDLIVQWLNELNFYVTVHEWILHDVVECRIKFDDPEWEGIFSIDGEPLNYEKHEICMEIKSVTYHQLNIQKLSSGYKTKIIFDI